VIRRDPCYKQYDRGMERIEPEPTDQERAAILAALEPTAVPADGWAEAALAEAVSGEAPGPLHEHDVQPLW
jgi:hypothetical protein